VAWWQIVLILLTSIAVGVLVGSLLINVIKRFPRMAFFQKEQRTAPDLPTEAVTASQLRPTASGLPAEAKVEEQLLQAS
jgi:hypothetical protein